MERRTYLGLVGAMFVGGCSEAEVPGSEKGSPSKSEAPGTQARSESPAPTSQTSPDPTPSPTPSPQATATQTNSQTPTGTRTQTEAPEPMFSEVRIEGDELLARLTEDGSDRVSDLRFVFPTDELGRDVASDQTDYRVNLLENPQAEGRWKVQAYNEKSAPIGSRALHPEIQAEISNVGTPAQLGATLDAKDEEHRNVQLMLTNSGQLPLHIGIGDQFTSTYGNEYAMRSSRALISGDVALSAGESAELRYPLYWPEHASAEKGVTHEATLDINVKPRGTISVPLSVTFGDTLEWGPSNYAYAEGTTVSLR